MIVSKSQIYPYVGQGIGRFNLWDNCIGNKDHIVLDERRSISPGPFYDITYREDQ